MGARRMGIAIVVVIVVGGLAAAIGLGAASDRAAVTEDAPSTTTTERDVAGDALDAVRSAIAPLAGELPDIVGQVRAWSEGTVSDRELGALLDRWEPIADRVVDAFAQLDLSGAPEAALGSFRASASLFRASLATYRSAVGVPAKELELRAQLHLLGSRLRVLGDRVFDRGRALVPAASLDAGIELRLPEEVPWWPAEELAAGPPLSGATPPVEPEDRFPLSADARPTQPARDWEQRVRALGLPSIAELRAGIAAEGVAGLDQLARRLLDGAEALRAEPDPDRPGGREESARVRLGLLVRAEAARAAQAAVLAGEPASRSLLAVAEQLTTIASEPALRPP